MSQLTTKELGYIEDEIRAEEIIAKTMNWCASLCHDADLKEKLEQMAENHQLRIADLSQYFNRSHSVQ